MTPITIEEAFGPDPNQNHHLEIAQVVPEVAQRFSANSERLLAEMLRDEGFDAD